VQAERARRAKSKPARKVWVMTGILYRQKGELGCSEFGGVIKFTQVFYNNDIRYKLRNISYGV
jgi:hypothetical protein